MSGNVCGARPPMPPSGHPPVVRLLDAHLASDFRTIRRPAGK